MCRSRGYITDKATNSETSCPNCDGEGLLKKEIPYKFDTFGKVEKEEIAEMFGISVDEVKDEGHSSGD